MKIYTVYRPWGNKPLAIESLEVVEQPARFKVEDRMGAGIAFGCGTLFPKNGEYANLTPEAAVAVFQARTRQRMAALVKELEQCEQDMKESYALAACFTHRDL